MIRDGLSFSISSQEQFDKRVGREAARHGNCYLGPGMYDAIDGAKHGPNRTYGICAPQIMSDLPEHRSPSGRHISGRAEMREECKRENWVPYEPVVPGWKIGGLTNRKFAKKRGLERMLSDTNRQIVDDRLDKVAKSAGVAKPRQHYDI